MIRAESTALAPREAAPAREVRFGTWRFDRGPDGSYYQGVEYGVVEQKTGGVELTLGASVRF